MEHAAHAPAALKLGTRGRATSMESLGSPVALSPYNDTILEQKTSAIPSPKLQQFDRQHANSYYSSVVKIYNFYSPPNISMPWQKHRQRTSTSSGFIIEGRRIICNAHGVRYSSEVRVRKPNDPTKYTARILAVGHECDLALLTVEDPDFFLGIHALNFGKVPALQSEVVVIGYPTGGDNISVTKGIVSRVDVTQYSHVGESLLAIQIDASINEGNSGGPTMMDGKVVGVAFETLVEAENIGYIIPTPVIFHFLEDLYRHSKYTGFCLANLVWQEIQNKSLRESLQMKQDQHGVLIAAISSLVYSPDKLRKNDVLMAFDGVPIADDGTVEYRHGERVSFKYLLSNKFIGETASFTVLRNGKVEMIEDVVMHKRKDLVPLHLYDRTPTYFVYAGLVFVELTRHWLVSEYGQDWTTLAPIALCNLAMSSFPEKEDEEVIVLSQVIVSELTFGYESLTNLRVNKLNGKSLNNVKELIDAVESSTDKFLTFELGKYTTVVLNREKCNEATPQILEDHQIGEQMGLSKAFEYHKPANDETIVGRSYLEDLNRIAIVDHADDPSSHNSY